MDNKTLKLGSFTAVLILILASCSTPWGPTKASAGKGTLRLSVPAVATWARTLGAKSPSSRALAAADSVVVSVYSETPIQEVPDKGLAATNLVDSWTQEVPSGSSGGAESTPPTGHGILEPGDYYLTVQVFNATVSTTVPVVAGQSTTFTVTANESSDVSVTCTPTNPTTLTEGEALAGQSFGAPWSYDVVDNVPQLVSHGGETWYAFTPSTPTTRLTLTPSETSNLVSAIAVFDSQGSSVGEVTYVLNSSPVVGTYTTVPGDTYYALVMDVGGTNASTEDRTATLDCQPVTGTVTGTLSLPASVVDKPYLVVVDTDRDGNNGWVSEAEGTVTGDNISYSVSAVPVGTYFVYAVVYGVGTPGQSPGAGDYYGVVGGAGTQVPNVTVGDGQTTADVAITLADVASSGEGMDLAALENAVIGGTMQALGPGFDSFSTALGSVVSVDQASGVVSATGPAALTISSSGISGSGTAVWTETPGSEAPFAFTLTETLTSFVIDQASGTSMSGTLNVAGVGVAGVSVTPVVTNSTVTIGGQEVLIKSFTYTGSSGSTGMPAYTAVLNINGTDYTVGS
jgi:hypothetical protein